MRGTFVPLYGLNNMFGQIPIVGLFLGGSNEGLLGVTYEVVGPPGAPVLRVNPISAVAPGLLRKFFEFPSGNGALRRRATPIRGTERDGSQRLQQHVPFPAERKLDDALAREVSGREHHLLVGDRLVVSPAARRPLMCRRASPFDDDEPTSTKAASTPRPASSRARDLDRRQGFGERPLLERAPRGLRGLRGLLAPCSSAVASVASTFFASLSSCP